MRFLILADSELVVLNDALSKSICESSTFILVFREVEFYLKLEILPCNNWIFKIKIRLIKILIQLKKYKHLPAA